MTALEEVAKEVLPRGDGLRLVRPLLPGEEGRGHGGRRLRPVPRLRLPDPRRRSTRAGRSRSACCCPCRSPSSARSSGCSCAGFDLDVYAQIGLVMLIGLAAKNAILIVEFAKYGARAGQDLVDAALEGARLRLRPILMTSFAFILGCVPLWIASGVGRRLAAGSSAPSSSSACSPPPASRSSSSRCSSWWSRSSHRGRSRSAGRAGAGSEASPAGRRALTMKRSAPRCARCSRCSPAAPSVRTTSGPRSPRPTQFRETRAAPADGRLPRRPARGGRSSATRSCRPSIDEALRNSYDVADRGRARRGVPGAGRHRPLGVLPQIGYAGGWSRGPQLR